MLNELDVVKAKRKLSEKVKQNTEGTIVMVYDEPRNAYEVEFVDSDDESLEILTVEAEDIEKIS